MQNTMLPADTHEHRRTAREKPLAWIRGKDGTRRRPNGALLEQRRNTTETPGCRTDEDQDADAKCTREDRDQ